MTGSIGQRSTPTHRTVTAVIASGSAAGAPWRALLSPVARVSPTTVAATPSRIACSSGDPLTPA
jgi:hypothetical protein